LNPKVDKRWKSFLDARRKSNIAQVTAGNECNIWPLRGGKFHNGLQYQLPKITACSKKNISHPSSATSTQLHRSIRRFAADLAGYLQKR
jgi:hypothetical protein